MLDIMTMKEWSVRTARLMVGIPDYQTYVDHRRQTHPDLPVMTYEEFFVERQNARYAVGKGRFRWAWSQATFGISGQAWTADIDASAPTVHQAEPSKLCRHGFAGL